MKVPQALPVGKQNEALHFSLPLSLLQVTYRHVIKTWPIKSLFFIVLIQGNQVTKHNLKPATWPQAQLEYIHRLCHIFLAFLLRKQTPSTTVSCDSRGALPTPYRIFSISCIQLRKLVPSGRDAVNKLKGKTGQRRLFFMIHYMLGGFDLCVMPRRIKPCLTVIYSTGHRQCVSCPSQCPEPSSEGETEKKKMPGPLCLGVWLQVRVQECVWVFSLLSCGSRKVSSPTITGSR